MVKLPKLVGFEENRHDLDKLIKKNVKFQGSFSHNYPIWEKCIKLLSKKKINISDMITHKLPLKKWVTDLIM